MKKLNPEYLIGIGLIVACIGGIFFDASSDIGLGITLLGCSSLILGSIIGFIVKQKLPDNQKTNHYFLTEKGLSLTPVIIELALWSHHNIKPVDNQDIANVKDKNELHLAIIERYKSKTVTL